MTWNAPNGISAAILAAAEAGEISHTRLVAALPQYTSRQISQSLDHLIGARGGLRRKGKRGRYTYERYRPEPRPMPVVEFKPLKRDLFEHWKLCERDPVESSRAAVHHYER